MSKGSKRVPKTGRGFSQQQGRRESPSHQESSKQRVQTARVQAQSRRVAQARRSSLTEVGSVLISTKDVALPLNSGRVRLITICLHVPPPSLATRNDSFRWFFKKERRLQSQMDKSPFGSEALNVSHPKRLWCLRFAAALEE